MSSIFLIKKIKSTINNKLTFIIYKIINYNIYDYGEYDIKKFIDYLLILYFPFLYYFCRITTNDCPRLHIFIYRGGGTNNCSFTDNDTHTDKSLCANPCLLAYCD